MYIKYIWFGLGGFFGISTIVGYLMPNPLYTCILNIYDLVYKPHFVDTSLNEPEIILLYSVKWFQIFLSNSNISIYYINHLFAHIEVVTSIAI